MTQRWKSNSEYLEMLEQVPAEEFLNVIIYDLLTNVTAIRSAADLIEVDYDNSLKQEMVTVIQESANEMVYILYAARDRSESILNDINPKQCKGE